MPLDMEQRFTYDKMVTTDDIMFVTGKAGTGKSYLLRQFIDDARKKPCVVVAPTGMAAINVGGQTIHSFFKLDWDVQEPEKLTVIADNFLRLRLQSIKVLVIDEVSMVRADVMAMIDRKLRVANGRLDEPFGGKQVIMFGDLYQLPPIVESNDDANNNNGLPAFFNDWYDNEFFFSAPVFKDNPNLMKTYELSEVHRQRDKDFVAILNRIRVGTVIRHDIDTLNSNCRRVPPDGQHYTILTPTNAVADATNHAKLLEINKEMFSYNAEVTKTDLRTGQTIGITVSSDYPDLKYLEYLEGTYPAPPILKLKVGAQIVMLENHLGGEWVNGTLGTISNLGADFVEVEIKGVGYTVTKKTWEKKIYSYDTRTRTLTQKPVEGFKQYPVKLAWALTIHKGQGQTYKAVAIDWGNGAFAAGQAYVALSRCVSMETLYLLNNVSSTDIIVNQDVVIFMQTVRPITIEDIKNAELERQLKQKEEEIECLKAEQERKIAELRSRAKGVIDNKTEEIEHLKAEQERNIAELRNKAKVAMDNKVVELKSSYERGIAGLQEQINTLKNALAKRSDVKGWVSNLAILTLIVGGLILLIRACNGY